MLTSQQSGGITIDEFRIALQDAINLPLRPYVVPFLKNHITLLQRDIAGLARSCNQVSTHYCIHFVCTDFNSPSIHSCRQPYSMSPRMTVQ